MEQAKSLRSFHNEVKSRVIQKYVSLSNGTSVLDIGTGRGGDMHKWFKHGLKNVVGIDVSKQYITEAIKRYNSNRYMRGSNYRFYYTASENMFTKYLAAIKCPLHFDVVTCMFALHYFCKTSEMLTDILSQVANVLPENGHFVCVAPLGEHIMNKLTESSTYKTNAFMVERRFETPNKIGDLIRFMLSGTLYFGDNFISEEYLIFKETLESCAAKSGLKLIEYYSFEKEYASIYGLDNLSKEASFLNGVIVFQKLPNESHKT